jgi:hypothetical protein
VNHQGQPIALVIADSLEQAIHATTLVRVTYAPEPGRTDIDRAEPVLPTQEQTDQGTARPPETRRGNPEPALATAEIKIDYTYVIPRENHNPIEMHATIAAWDGDHLTLWDKTQWVHNVADEIAAVFGIRAENVRVISPFVDRLSANIAASETTAQSVAGRLYLLGTPTGWAQFRAEILQHDALRATILGRSTQTNEPGRCAALLPVLARLPQSLALLEVGASAGLCLLPNFYAYDYGGHTLGPASGRLTAPVFPSPSTPPRLSRHNYRTLFGERASISIPST